MTASCVRRCSREVKTPPHQNIVVLGSLHSMAGHCSLSPPSTPRGSSDIPLSFRIASVRLGHLSQPEPRGLPEKVKDFTKIYKFASVVTIIEIAFVGLHIIIKSLVSLLATFPLPECRLQQQQSKAFFQKPMKMEFPSSHKNVHYHTLLWQLRIRWNSYSIFILMLLILTVGYLYDHFKELNFANHRST